MEEGSAAGNPLFVPMNLMNEIKVGDYVMKEPLIFTHQEENAHSSGSENGTTPSHFMDENSPLQLVLNESDRVSDSQPCELSPQLFDEDLNYLRSDNSSDIHLNQVGEEKE